MRARVGLGTNVPFSLARHGSYSMFEVIPRFGAISSSILQNTHTSSPSRAPISFHIQLMLALVDASQQSFPRRSQQPPTIHSIASERSNVVEEPQSQRS